MRNAAKEYITGFEPIYDVCLFPEEMKLPKYKPFIMVAFSYGKISAVKHSGTINIFKTTHFKTNLISKN